MSESIQSIPPSIPLNHLNKVILDKAKTFSNWFPKGEAPLSNLQWVKKKHMTIASKIDSMYDSLQTKHTMFYALASILKHLDPKDPMVEKYRHKYTAIQKQIDNQSYKQELSESQKKNWQTEADIVKLRDYWYEKSNDGRNESAYRKFLCLALYTLQAPIRAEWADMKIIHDTKQDDGIQNCLLVASGKMIIILNSYKTKRKYGKKRIDVTAELHDVIETSLKLYPREWVLWVLSKNKPIGKRGFNQFLDTISKKKISVDLLRSSYITNFYSKHPLYKSKMDLAYKMCNSVAMSEIAYNKPEH